jgi:hypothetical protein
MIKIAPFEMICQNTQKVIRIGEKYLAIKTPQGIRPVKVE